MVAIGRVPSSTRSAFDDDAVRGGIDQEHRGIALGNGHCDQIIGGGAVKDMSDHTVDAPSARALRRR